VTIPTTRNNPNPCPSLPASPGSSEVASEHQESPDWKQTLRDAFERSMTTIEQYRQHEPPPSPSCEEPDLYSFFESLGTLTTDTRKANRRTAETFAQWGTVLSEFQLHMEKWGGQIQTLITAREQTLNRETALVFIEILDRIERLVKAASNTPPQKWWTSDAAWRETWSTQSQALSILHQHIIGFLNKEGIRRMDPTGKVFDPIWMTATSVKPSQRHPANTVIETETPAYLKGADVLRIAHVSIAAQKTQPDE